MTDTVWTVLYVNCPVGQDGSDTRCCAAGGVFFESRDAACSYVKARFDELLKKEKADAAKVDEEWAAEIDETDMKEIGYEWNRDFSTLSFSPKLIQNEGDASFSWGVVELKRQT